MDKFYTLSLNKFIIYLYNKLYLYRLIMFGINLKFLQTNSSDNKLTESIANIIDKEWF